MDRVERPDGEASWRPSPGGLVTALEPVMREADGVWVGWSGDAESAPGAFEANCLDLLAVGLSAEQVRDYYEGFCNATLWPLYHDVIASPQFERRWWEAYVAVNGRSRSRRPPRWRPAPRSGCTTTSCSWCRGCCATSVSLQVQAIDPRRHLP